MDAEVLLLSGRMSDTYTRWTCGTEIQCVYAQMGSSA